MKARLTRNNFFPAAFLVTLALLSFWPVSRSHPLMDDHLFFSWLEETPWQKAIELRLTGNWIPYFNQMQVYRPAAGLLQVLMYHLFGTAWFLYHAVNLSLHLLTSLLAGLLTRRLTQSRAAGWLCGGLLLLHPRTANGIALIYNFYDPIVACLMLLALNCLWSLEQIQRSHRPLYMLGLCCSVAWSLGSKEVALPLVPTLILADLLWKDSKVGPKSLLKHQSVPMALLILYLAARTYFIGHPFYTHLDAASFPLPAHANYWAYAWDGILLGVCFLVAFGAPRLLKSQSLLPSEFRWMVFWAGLMLLPAVHFCAQMTLRPWFFDERYWYLPLVPLCSLTAALIVHGSFLSALLGAGLLAFTLPGPWGLFVGIMAYLAAGPLDLLNQRRDISILVESCYAIALAVLLWVECGAVGIRAGEAADVQQKIARLAAQVPSDRPVVLLNFSEQTVEPHHSFNGDLQWLLKPPFFSEDLNQRFFFAYPTWDPPPSLNRFQDRITPRLLTGAESQQPVYVFMWDSANRVFLYSEPRPDRLAEEIKIEARLEGTANSTGEEQTQWTVSRVRNFDRTRRHFLEIKVLLGHQTEVDQTTIRLRWLAFASQKSYSVSLPLSLSGLRLRGQEIPKKIKLVFPIGNYVDWTFAERVSELRISAPKAVQILDVQFGNTERDCPAPDMVLTHYLFPKKRFLQIGESRVFFEP